MNADLLFELGCEELPPAPLQAMAGELGQRLTDGLSELGIDTGEARIFATPRRLAVLIRDVADRQPDRDIERRGPATKAPEKAVAGFARSCGVDVDALDTIETDKGPYYVFRGQETGQPLADILPPLIVESIRKLTTPKRMRWGSLDEGFLRPVQWMVCLHGNTVIPVELFGLTADRLTSAHRFHAPEPIALERAGDYETTLFDHQVIAAFEERRKIVAQQVKRTAERAGGIAQMDPDLVDEVTALVEWPVALSGQIDERFMAMPPEVLITTIESHQRYFPVRDADGQLLPRFVTVANVESLDIRQVVLGNERVVRPRLEDALFFWEKDRKQSLAQFGERLDKVTFQKGLGSYADKTRRLGALTASLAEALGADANTATRAATLAKADLVTDMVFEFTELEGIVGGYYARASGESDAVAAAIAEQYQPRGPSDDIPATDAGRMLALADKFDTLAGQFALGNRPTGDRDPLGLRRAALGVLRILLEAEQSLDLQAAVTAALSQQPVTGEAESKDALLSFFADRLRGLLADQGIGTDVFEAVTALQLRDPLEIQRRSQAVLAFQGSAAANSLAAAHKRVRNILKKNGEDAAAVDIRLFEADAERSLHETMSRLADQVTTLVTQGDYAAALTQLATLQGPVDQFFEDVMVMAEDAAVRSNRLRLLTQLDGLLRQIADFSHLSN
ncbi:MAG: glycine--tRNA ligase subunit beta [Pseudomonadota bacterium]|nr:glycine--tRNA ligase subunit beta [Pseudomonadota bacterium]